MMRIVSIDGGGIKGYLPALVLAELEAQAGVPIDVMADMLAGTSTGAILALGLAAGKSAEEMAAFYQSKGPAIFRRTWGKRLRSLFGLADEQYSNDALHAGLVEIFGDKRLSDISTPCMAVGPFFRLGVIAPILCWLVGRVGRDRGHDAGRHKAKLAQGHALSVRRVLRLERERERGLPDGGHRDRPTHCGD